MQYLYPRELVSFCVSSGKRADHLKEKFVKTVNFKDREGSLICSRRAQVLPDGTNHGKEWRYSVSDGLQSETEWKDGVRHGKTLLFHDGSAKVLEERNYVNGLENGKYISRDREGDIQIEAETKDGFFHGKWVRYERGYPTVEKNYVNGVLEGKVLKHSSGGNYTSVSYFKNSLPMGESEIIQGINPYPPRNDDSEDDGAMIFSNDYSEDKEYFRW